MVARHPVDSGVLGSAAPAEVSGVPGSAALLAEGRPTHVLLIDEVLFIYLVTMAVGYNNIKQN